MSHNRSSCHQIDTAIEDALREQRIVGVVVLVAKNGKLVYQRAAGFADREARKPVELDTIFRLASLSKAIVSAGAMALIERRLINLEDPITEWLPEFRPRTVDGKTIAVTVRQLLTHTAGLHYGFLQLPDGPYRSAGISDGFDGVPAQGLSMNEQLRRIMTVPLSFAPGTAWCYSVATDVLGEILARVTNQSLADVIAETITAPLQMKDTDFRVAITDRLATPYVNAMPPRRMADPDSVPFFQGALLFSPSRIFRSDAFPSGGSGMAGTASDYLAFLEAIRTGGGKILSSESVRVMMSNQIGDLRITTEQVPAWGFGIGGAVLLDPELAQLPQAAGTWKWGGTYGTHWFVDPHNRLTVVALTNTTTEGMIGTFVNQLTRAVYR